MFIFFFFNDTATTEIYTLSLHDALPISRASGISARTRAFIFARIAGIPWSRSEEHTSELQSRSDLVCRLLLEKKKNNTVAYEYQGHTWLRHRRTYLWSQLRSLRVRGTQD